MQIPGVHAHSVDVADYFKRCLGSHTFTQVQSEPEGLTSRRVCFREGTSWCTGSSNSLSPARSAPLSRCRLAERGTLAQFVLYFRSASSMRPQRLQFKRKAEFTSYLSNSSGFIISYFLRYTVHTWRRGLQTPAEWLVPHFPSTSFRYFSPIVGHRKRTMAFRRVPFSTLSFWMYSLRLAERRTDCHFGVDCPYSAATNPRNKPSEYSCGCS